MKTWTLLLDLLYTKFKPKILTYYIVYFNVYQWETQQMYVGSNKESKCNCLKGHTQPVSAEANATDFSCGHFIFV